MSQDGREEEAVDDIGMYADAETEPPAEIERRASALDLPRLITGVLGDIRAIAEGMAVLPKVLTTLQGIERRVDTLNDEVAQMRKGVDTMSGDVVDMKGSMARLEPHLEDVTRVVHPLRRINERNRRRERESGS